MLIMAGAGGVGSIAIQIATKVLGLTVVATASRPETIAYCKEKGAHHVVNHRNDLKSELEKVGVPKVDFVFNLADWGDSQLDAWASVLKPLGHIASILPPNTALEAGTMAKLFFLRANFHLELMWVRTLTGTEPKKQGDILDAASRLFDSGTLQHTLTKTLPFTAAGLQEGHKIADSGASIGKVCLVREGAAISNVLQGTKLIYFPIRGRGEPIRMTFAACGVEYVEEALDFEAMKKDAGTTVSPFGQAPFVLVGDVRLAQMIPIMRFIAANSKPHLCGQTPFEKAQVDMVLAATDDLYLKYIECVYKQSLSQEGRDAVWEKHFDPASKSGNNGGAHMLYLADMLKRNGGKFLVGSQLTLADIFFWFSLECYVRPQCYGEKVYQTYSGLKAYFDAVADHEIVKGRLADSARAALPLNANQQG